VPLESVWLANVALAAGASYVLFVQREAPVFMAIASAALWIGAALGATNVISDSGAVASAYSSTAMFWFGVLMVAASGLAFLFAVFGLWGEDEDDTESGAVSGVSEVGEHIERFS